MVKIESNSSKWDYNILPFESARRTDKRNIFQVFKSILFDKLESVNLILSNKRIKMIYNDSSIILFLLNLIISKLLYIT